MDLKQLVSSVYEQGGGEVHLKIGSTPIIRQNKFLKRLSLPPIAEGDIRQIVENFLTKEQQKKFNDQQRFEGSYFGPPPYNFRLNLYKAQGETFALVRIIRKAIPNFAEIGLPASLEIIPKAKMGLFIIAGPARSGISTLLAAIVEQINQTRPVHILVIEDPIEFYFEPKKARISQRQFKKDVLSLEQGINFSKRMDVDVLVIGDLKRDVPFKNVLDFADGDNFVILTMQTLGIQNTLEKILSAFPKSDYEHACNLLANNLLGICSQTLILNPADGKMVPIHEVLFVNNSIKGIIQKGRITQIDPNIRIAGEGSFLFETELGTLMREGKLTKEGGEGFLNTYRGVKG